MSRHKNSKLKSLVSLGTACTIGMYLINNRIFSSAGQKNILHTENGAFYAWKHGNIYYEVYGDSALPPLLLIHNINPTASGLEWEKTIDVLSREKQVYVIDLPGCGRSDKPAVTYTNYFYALAISSFIQDVIKRPVTITAAGLAASAAVSATALCKDQITRLVMVNPEALSRLCAVPQEESRILRTLISLPVLGTFLYNIRYNHPNVENSILEKQVYNPFLLSQRYTDGAYEAAHLGDGSGKYLMASLDGRYVNFDIRRFIASLSVPTCIISSEKSQGQEAIVKQYCKLNKEIKAVTVRASRGMPQVEVPDTFSAKLLSLIS